MFTDLRSFLSALEKRGQLVRIHKEVDPNQEITIIQHHVMASGGPALLFERVKGSAYRVVTNLFGTRRRVAMACGEDPALVGARIVRMAEKLMPPSVSALWHLRQDIRRLLPARLRTVAKGPVLERVARPADLNQLPVLTCWPLDGGAFFTWPLVHTVDPESGQGNLGVYRLQRFDAGSTGMHWQIEKGGGFHFHKAAAAGKPLPVSVILGGPPALTIAAVTPLPEGIDERLLAAYLMGRALDVIHRPGSGHRVPAFAEFVLEGEVRPGDVRLEGPFGDHLGHYSAAADYPVLRVKRILSRRNAIYPATVVGKPVQEDYFIGEALQEMTLPLLRMIKPAVVDLWAYPETGFHPLAVMAVNERYRHEALKLTLSMLGEGQVSLTKVMVTVDRGVDVRNFEAVSAALWRNLVPEKVHLLSPTAQDTLDFTGPAMNTGSRLILLATGEKQEPIRRQPPTPPSKADLPPPVTACRACGPAVLMVQVGGEVKNFETLRNALLANPAASAYLFIVVVSDDVPLQDPILSLWGWFTRFDPASDIYPARRHVAANRLLFQFPIVIDARWKEGYPLPVAFDPRLARKVAEQWEQYGIPVDLSDSFARFSDVRQQKVSPSQ